MDAQLFDRLQAQDAQIDGSLARAALCDALVRGITGPDESALEPFVDLEAFAALSDAGRVLEASGAYAGLGTRLDALRAAAVAEAARDSAPGALEADRQRLFGHTARGEAPPYETEYGALDSFRQSQELADLGGFYSAFGLTVDRAFHERADHVALELEFLLFLAGKEAYERSAAHDDVVEQVLGAQKLFVRDHIGRFGRAFARSLSENALHPFHKALGELCSVFLDGESKRLGLPAGPEWIALRPENDYDVPMACGNCPLPGNANGGEPDDEDA